jgi:hypothetical protein
MSLANNLAALGRLLTAAATGVINGVTTEWFKAEQAAEGNQGTARVATQTITNAGTDDTTMVTPKKLRAGFAFSAGANGYIAFPSWLGGLILQWGVLSVAGTGNADVITLPTTFPTGFINGIACDGGSGIHACAIASATRSTITCYGGTYSGSTTSYSATSYRYLVLGN